ncbi:hypothetical protein [Leptolinea tardivitalis]|uniref:hypothetical protein n=1 Tax=Leptolinea tardivitalis TaxID=229920 RepID=UPI0011118ED3|nr:hypothetical protein [Leptolinea tardivitalis]
MEFTQGRRNRNTSRLLIDAPSPVASTGALPTFAHDACLYMPPVEAGGNGGRLPFIQLHRLLLPYAKTQSPVSNSCDMSMTNCLLTLPY